MNIKTNNERAAKMAEILKQAGCTFHEVTALGVFFHIGCLCDDAARRVGKVIASCGEFQVLKITHRRDLAENQNPKHNQCGHSTYVDRYTLHAKLK